MDEKTFLKDGRIIMLPVLGQRALTAMASDLNSSAMPKTHMDIPYLAMVYATWFWNQTGFMFNGGLMLRMCGFFPTFRYGRHSFDLNKNFR